MEFKGKVVIISGGSSGIGKTIKERFIEEGARVYSIDINPNSDFIGDVSKKSDLDSFIDYVLKKEKGVDYIINNAPPLFIGLDNCSYEDFSKSLNISATSTFYFAKRLKDYLSDSSAIINITSTRDNQSMPNTEAYVASKGALKALTHALSVTLGPKTRVNAIAPGWILTKDYDLSESDLFQQPVGRVGNTLDISNMVLYLCSSKASFITGEEIVIDGGMSKLMIYHDENGWTYKK